LGANQLGRLRADLDLIDNSVGTFVMRGENPHAGTLRYVSPRALAASDHVDSLVGRFEGLFYASSAMTCSKMMVCTGHDPLRFESAGGLVNAGYFAGAWIGCTGYHHRAEKEKRDDCENADGKIWIVHLVSKRGRHPD